MWRFRILPQGGDLILAANDRPSSKQVIYNRGCDGELIIYSDFIVNFRPGLVERPFHANGTFWWHVEILK